MSHQIEHRMVTLFVIVAALALAALVGGYLGLIFGGLTQHALTITV